MDSVIVWLRQDLRLADNPALNHALQLGGQVCLVYIHAPDECGTWTPGAASNWWLHHSLKRLAADIANLGGQLILRNGSSLDILLALAAETGSRTITCNYLYEPAARKRDHSVAQALAERGITLIGFHGNLLHPPGTILTQSGQPYRVFTPFWATCQREHDGAAPLPAPERLPPSPGPSSLPLEVLDLLPRVNWYGGLASQWSPGEAGAWARWNTFSATRLEGYARARDVPGEDGTSRLSPHLHFGEVSPRQLVHATKLLEAQRTEGAALSSFRREIGWREFAYHVLYHFPKTPLAPLDPRFVEFPWSADESAATCAWQRGQTGISLIDAGMRELWHTGWMHNRVRMIVASWLTKNLGQHWLTGARWFWDTLVDADLAANTLNWQWVAGCGADAAPYLRIFNPVLQGEKFDPQGSYVRRWLPELSHLPDKHIHAPWRAPESILRGANLRLGVDYPAPVADPAASRIQALDRYRAMR